jgi:hypothetical protein
MSSANQISSKNSLVFIIRATPRLVNCKTRRSACGRRFYVKKRRSDESAGGWAGGGGIKVGSIVRPRYLRSNRGGTFADMVLVFCQRLSMPSAMVRNHAR